MDFLKANLAVFSNAKNHRRDPLVPLVVPTVNPSHLDVLHHQRKHFGVEKGFLVCNSNCAVIGLVIPFAALQSKFGAIDQVSVVTMQAVSGAGYPGVSSMDILDVSYCFIRKLHYLYNKLILIKECCPIHPWRRGQIRDRGTEDSRYGE
jgi:aspartate-semialdehyde dehydrogenase